MAGFGLSAWIDRPGQWAIRIRIRSSVSPSKRGGGDGWMDAGSAERVIVMVGALALATSARPAGYRLGPKRPTEQQWITRVMGSAPVALWTSLDVLRGPRATGYPGEWGTPAQSAGSGGSIQDDSPGRRWLRVMPLPPSTESLNES